MFDYDPSTMSPNPDGCEEELPFQEGDIIKVVERQTFSPSVYVYLCVFLFLVVSVISLFYTISNFRYGFECTRTEHYPFVTIIPLKLSHIDVIKLVFRLMLSVMFIAGFIRIYIGFSKLKIITILLSTFAKDVTVYITVHLTRKYYCILYLSKSQEFKSCNSRSTHFV